MSQSDIIPFSKPYVAPNAIKYVEEALNSDHHQGGGFFNKKAADLVKEINGGGEVFLTSSCTQALEMATILLDLKPGDEVIMPSYTFTSAATALVNFGIIPVFVDIEPVHLNIDPNRVREAITSRTKAISLVNYAGYACDFSALDEIANEFGLLKIEDNAHGFGATSNDFKLGNWGDVSTLSFHATKNVQCGEGGALIVNNKKYVDRAHVLQEKGTNRKEFLTGAIEKYQWVDKGGSFLLSEVNSALLTSQLEMFSTIQENRKAISYNYEKLFQNLNSTIITNFSRNAENHSSHMFFLQFTSKMDRDIFIEYMNKNDVQCVFHYQSLGHTSMGSRFTRINDELLTSRNASETLVRLPIFVGIDNSKLLYINALMQEFFIN